MASRVLNRIKPVLSQDALKQLFIEARTEHGWLPKPVSDQQLKDIYDSLKWGPTAFNSLPAHIVFVKSDEAKQRLLKHLAPGNVRQASEAPVTAIIARNYKFYENFPITSPTYDAGAVFKKEPHLIEPTAIRGTTLMGAYLMLAARAHGLDCGPMSGFDNDKLDADFFKDQPHLKSDFICSIGYGDETKRYPRAPRLKFEELCKIL